MIEWKTFGRQAAHFLFGDYEYYHLFRFEKEWDQEAPAAISGESAHVQPIDAAAIEAGPDPLLREQIEEYAGDEALLFGCFLGQRLIGICAYWFGGRYREKRNFLKLAPDEAKLVQIVLLPEWRGCGFGRKLIIDSGRAVIAHGFVRLYARVWHSNTASKRAFRQAGWRDLGSVLELYPLRRSRPWHVSLLDAKFRHLVVGGGGGDLGRA